MVRVLIKGVADIGELIGHRGELDIILSEGTTLQDLLGVMKEMLGESFAKRIFKQGSNEINDDLRLLINGQDIIFLNNLNTELRDNDRFSIIPPLAGG